MLPNWKNLVKKYHECLEKGNRHKAQELEKKIILIAGKKPFQEKDKIMEALTIASI